MAEDETTVEAPQEDTGEPVTGDDEPGEGEESIEGPGDDEGAEDADTSNGDVPSASGLSEEEIEERFRKLELESKRHTKRISEVMGDDAPDLIVCPFCEPEMQGFLRMESLDHPRDEIHAAMTEVLRKPAQVNYLDSPHATQCPACGGRGKGKSGSLVPGEELIMCPRCTGRGYLSEGSGATNGAHTDPGAAVPALVGPPSAVVEDFDVFGSPRKLADGVDNPNYGKTLQYKDPQIESEYLRRLTGS